MNDIRRTILWVVFGFSMVMLWDQWQVANGNPATFFPSPKPAATASWPMLRCTNPGISPFAYIAPAASSKARIVSMVSEAQRSRAPIQRLADQVGHTIGRDDHGNPRRPGRRIGGRIRFAHGKSVGPGR